MRVYLAARFSRRFEMQGHRGDLQRAGHAVTSRWIDLVRETEADAAKCARVDIEDIETADTLIGFSDPPCGQRVQEAAIFSKKRYTRLPAGVA